ncbi:hypothetical protein [Elizabethkingia anophelis]|uniref:hypothetical protein n=1 Tax=Elizabethkingia anophelis TaxID=1117645 RepID=UPI001623CE9C|nr:hypothetical protein [Elizabethkingia anophelis]MCT4321832.1 hypothetical protein [Elizabethkingia anophelis]
METPKQQAIKAAYGEHWDKVKDYVDEDGWCTHPDKNEMFPEIDNLLDSGYVSLWENTAKWMPTSLNIIIDNNGWTRIESEEDLPKDDYFGDLFEVGFLDESGFFHHDKKRCSFKSLKWMYEKKLITHYQLVEKPKPPIF